MKLNQFKSKIKAYLRGSLPQEEMNQVDDWFDAVSKDEKRAVFENDSHKSKIRTSLLSNIQEHIPLKTQTTRRIRKYSWIAAAAVVIAMVFLLQNHKGIDHTFARIFPSKDVIYQDSLSTVAGQLQQVRMPDGSTIWLSGNSKIRFNNSSFAENRRLILEQGEVFFDVFKDRNHPFLIESNGILIKVLGTSFNVRQSTESQSLSVEVKTGTVSVSRNKDEHVLKVGNTISYVGDTYQLAPLNPDFIGLWSSGGMFVEHASFKELQEIIWNRFALKLKSNVDSRAFEYSLFLPKVQSIEQLMDIVCSIHQTKYRRIGNEIIID